MKVLISAGPTREKIDPVRFISSRSSGKMGYALAEAALAAGHNVILVSGPVHIAPPGGAKLLRVESAAEMAREIRKMSPKADMIIMAAAVSDYRPVKSCVSKRKIKKNSDAIALSLEKTEDILKSLGQNKRKGQLLVGFAAETEKLLANAKIKLREKNLDWIIANNVSKKGVGFDSDYNEALMVSRHGRKIKIPKNSKKNIAQKIIRIISEPIH